MEGLIPMVYKTIKKSRTRRHYEYLSSGAVAAAAQRQSYNIADFYTKDDCSRQYAAENNNINAGHHMRHKSLNADYRGGFSPENTVLQSKKLVRFRSHRFFSCVTGA